MAKPIDTQNVSIDKKASAAALAAILAAEPPWLSLDTVRRQQGRAIARADASGWQPRDFVEGLQQFEAEEGDVVYVPRQTWHLASNGGKDGERSCRLAMNGFPYQAHMYEAD